MLLTKVTLKNYGVYRNENVFDFTCTPDKPIILIGGTNGAGKTTLFESIVLCLYGMSIFDKRTSRKTYEKYLNQKIHRYIGTPASADHASIIVQFKFFHDGHITEYYVDRTWKNEDGRINEQLVIKKRDSENESFKELDSIEESHWQSFIEGLIPRGISKLFFFDGEKIVEIAEKESQDIAIKSSFNSLLGLDLVEQLRADLQVNLMRNLKGDEKHLQVEFDNHSKDKANSEEKISEFRAKISLKEGELDQIHKEIDELEAKISSIGGNFAMKRDELKSKKEVYQLRLESVSKNIQELCMGVLPFSIIPHNLEQVKNQLNKDSKILKKKFEDEFLDSKVQEITKSLNSNELWNEFNFDKNTKENLIEHLLKFFKPISNQQQEEGLFNFSVQDTSKLLDKINKANGPINEKLQKETGEFYKINEELQKIETSLVNAPNDDEIGPLISKLTKKHSQAGSIQTEIDHIDQAISNDLAFIRHLNVKLREIVEKRFRNEKAQNSANLTEQIQKVLDEYAEQLKIKKIRLLEQYLLEAIHTLMHKKNFITKVTVDKDSFEITLLGENGLEIAKDLLSKGEKQMFATAVLWALAKTSGKPLPFMIDTPLARLDVEHRSNLVDRFFPLASHQVIIFSTDSEIDAKTYQKLYPYITRSYSMQYEPGKGKTKQHSSYFWNKQGEKAIEV